MTVVIFANCVFFLKVKKLKSLEQNKLKSCIKENGGQITFVLNHECTHVVTDDVSNLSSIHQKVIQKYQLLVVDPDFIWSSVKERRLLQAYRCETPKPLTCMTGIEKSFVCEGDYDIQEEQDVTEKKDESNDKNKFNDNSSMGVPRWFTDTCENIPYFPKDFEVAKYDILEKVAAYGEYVVVELQCFRQQCDYPFRISAHYTVIDGHQDQKRFIPAKTCEEARRTYMSYIEQLKENNFQLQRNFPIEAEYFASAKLQEILVAEAISSQTLSKEVARFVELIWVEALGLLNHLLAKPVTSISLNDVSKAEGILLRLKKALDNKEEERELSIMLSEFYKIIPHKSSLDYNVTKKLLSNKQDLCQLIRDMLNVSETNMSAPNPSSFSKYRALRCRIDALESNSEEFCKVKQILDQNGSECPVQVFQIYKVGRITEAAAFESHLDNIQSLIHASSPRNFVGILSRGLLLPQMASEEHGLERTDLGNLGSGIYFSNSISTSIKYSQPSQTDGTRLLVICEVALGTSWDTCQTDYSLTAAPLGYDSVHGVCKKDGEDSAFEGDEFVVYRTSQVKIKYVVRFSLANDEVKEFSPEIQTESEDLTPSLTHELHPEDYKMPSQNILDNITAGLLDKSGNPIPLKNIHIKGRIIDFVAEVVVFQTYENKTNRPIEAKYVFPLDDTAAVCGFEAFIKGKHIVGKIKEKEEAHQLYRDAVIRGHGAYLMDQDTPDIFTVSVGNLPPSTKVLIKITYVTELSFSGCLSFHLPAAVAPWQQDKALNESTQDSVQQVFIKQVGIKAGAFSLEMSIEMPFKINHITSWTHQLQIKKTDCKAVVRTVEGSSLNTSGFAMKILIGDAYLPRMWVEKHPDKNSEACMLVFQPEFDASLDPLPSCREIIVCLDCSNSMAGSEIQQAKQIALRALDSCYFATKLSVIKFGTNFVEFPFYSEDSTANYAALKEFIKSATATMGSSDLWKALHYLSLLYPSEGMRNILLISDGHIQNEGLTLQIVKDNAKHTRMFTCGVGSTANRHMLRSLSQYGAGAFEYFDAKSKYNWERKVKHQADRMSSAGCSAVSIKWQQFDTDRPTLMYAPAHIQSLFHQEHLLFYGFISHCTQATLNALVGNQELQTMVSTTELQKTTGTILHKLAARAFIKDYEQGLLHEKETEHEMKKQQLKSLIIDLSLENSIITQFTSFVAIEKRDTNEEQIADTSNILELVAKEDVDILPYIQYTPPAPSINNIFAAAPSGQAFSSSRAGMFGSQSSSGFQISSQAVSGTKSDGFSFGSYMPTCMISAPKVHWSPPPPAAPCSTTSLRQKYLKPLDGRFETNRSYLQLVPETIDLELDETPLVGMEEYQSSPAPYTFAHVALNEEDIDRSMGEEEDIYTVLEEEDSPVPLTSKFLASHHMKEKMEDYYYNNYISTSMPPHSSLVDEEQLIEMCSLAIPKKRAKKRSIKLQRTVGAQKLPQASWPQLFKLQNQDGFWELTPELGVLLNIDTNHLVNVLAKKGIQSLGPKGKEKLLWLIATLLVLQIVRFERLEGLVFKYLTKLDDSPFSWAFCPVNKAAEWARKTDREFPAICQRLELGKDWNSATKKLLGIE